MAGVVAALFCCTEPGLDDVTNVVTAFDPDQEIAWTVRGRFSLGHVYRYHLEPINARTLVTAH